MREISKRKRHNHKRRHGKRRDLISQLPDHLLHQILLKLPTKNSVKTSVLSSRWRYLWQRVPGLDLNYTDFRYDRLKGFVNRFLDLDKKSLICQLKLNFDSDEYKIKRSQLRRWLNSVVTRGVEHLVVDACSVDSFDVNNCCPVKLPVSICTCETLVHLKLEYVHMRSFELVSLPRLETMHLVSVWFPSEVALEKLISSSQVLRVLDIDEIRNVKVLRVRSQTLNSLTICVRESNWRKDDQTKGVVIDAPRVKCLRLQANQFINLVVNSLCSRFEIVIDIFFGPEINFYPTESDPLKMETLRNFLAVISKVTNLAHSCSTLKVMYAYLRLEVEPLPQLPNLTHLEFTFRSSVSELLPTFLASCPNLKSLELRNHGSVEKSEISRPSVPKCLLTSLEFVEILSLTEKYPVETKLVEYLLRNAAVLRELTFFLPSGAAQDSFEVVAQVLTFPRRSSACQVFAHSC